MAPPLLAPPPVTLQCSGAVLVFLGSGMTLVPSALMSSLSFRKRAHWLFDLQTSGPISRDEGKGCAGRHVMASGSPVPSGRGDMTLSAAKVGTADTMRKTTNRRTLHGMGTS